MNLVQLEQPNLQEYPLYGERWKSRKETEPKNDTDVSGEGLYDLQSPFPLVFRLNSKQFNGFLNDTELVENKDLTSDSLNFQ